MLKPLFVGAVDKLDTSECFITVCQRDTDIGIDVAVVNSFRQKNCITAAEYFSDCSFSGRNRMVKKRAGSLSVNGMKFSIAVFLIVPDNRTFGFADFPNDMNALPDCGFKIFGSGDDGLDISDGPKVLK